MAKDYFQDILPPHENPKRPSSRSSSLKRDPDMRPTKSQVVAAEQEDVIAETDDADTIEIPSDESLRIADSAPERSIRNISAPVRRPRDEQRDTPRYASPLPRHGRSYRGVVWALAVVGVLVVLSLLLVALRGTSVSVVPRSHTVVFDETSRFTAYPSPSGTPGSLSYVTETLTLEETEVVQSSGTTRVEEKARGTITVYNDSTTAAYRLVKNTRFESANGMIFRAPNDIVIPGKSGSVPGQVTVEVVADAAGEQYNIAPGRLTVPGLSGGADFSRIYAQAISNFAGGFIGERPSVSEADMAGAQAAIRGRLEQKIRESISALNSAERMAFPEIAAISYEPIPTQAENGSARLGEKATVVAPIIISSELAKAVARTVSADSDSVAIRIVGIKDFGGLPVLASSTPGIDPVQFTLTGQAILVWDVNGNELAQALAGRDQSAFQTIVTGFPGIQSATARIEPFWSDSFPSDAGSIKVRIADPAAE